MINKSETYEVRVDFDDNNEPAYVVIKRRSGDRVTCLDPLKGDAAVKFYERYCMTTQEKLHMLVNKVNCLGFGFNELRESAQNMIGEDADDE